MVDAKKLLDALVGAAAANRRPAEPGRPIGGNAGLGDLLASAIGQFTKPGQPASSTGRQLGADAGDLLGRARTYLDTPEGRNVASAVLGGLAGLVVGSKSGRKLAGSAAALGGLGLIGGLAYKAYRAWQEGQPTAASARPSPAQALTPPSGSPFSVEQTSQDTALILLRAMIAAANADGHVDTVERGRIIGSLQQAGFDLEATKFLDAEFANPVSVTKLAEAVRTPELASEVYTAARLAIEPDTPEEQAFLRDLADALSLDPALVAHLDAAATSAKATGQED